MAGLFSHRPVSAMGRSPFRPGRGTLPPHLAGRETEQARICEHLDVVAGQGAPPADIVIYGPRGNGKTALLLWARREAEARGIDVLRIPGVVARTLGVLARRATAMPHWLRWLRGASLSPVGSVKLMDRRWEQLTAILARRSRQRPTLLVLDEAHRLGLDAGEALLNAVQDLQGDGEPVMLILAGTPDLPRHLSAMGASFWDRSEQLPIGRLRPASAADAIRVPLEEHGRSITADALNQVVKESHGYPFFLQIWGDLLWKGRPDPSAPTSRGDMDRAQPLFERRRELYYDRRYDELDRAGLISVAAGVAAEFSRAERVVRERVRIAIRSALQREGRGKAPDPAAVREAERVLRHRGYIWPVVQQRIAYYEPGIPSLMRHVTLNEEKNREVRDGAS